MASRHGCHAGKPGGSRSLRSVYAWGDGSG